MVRGSWLWLVVRVCVVCVGAFVRACASSARAASCVRVGGEGSCLVVGVSVVCLGAFVCACASSDGAGSWNGDEGLVVRGSRFVVRMHASVCACEWVVVGGSWYACMRACVCLSGSWLVVDGSCVGG